MRKCIICAWKDEIDCVTPGSLPIFAGRMLLNLVDLTLDVSCRIALMIVDFPVFGAPATIISKGSAFAPVGSTSAADAIMSSWANIDDGELAGPR